VLLLNADTEATPGFLDRIEQWPRATTRIGSVTPFSNNAEICSWPEFCRPNPVPTRRRCASRGLRDRAPPARYPTCRRASASACGSGARRSMPLGDFDQATFGRGYGEENDFCLRAAGMVGAMCSPSTRMWHMSVMRLVRATGERAGGENLRACWRDIPATMRRSPTSSRPTRWRPGARIRATGLRRASTSAIFRTH
jgi:GT2 family glycosyltransferase